MVSRVAMQLEAQALEDKPKERLHFFHATIWMAGTLMTHKKVDTRV